MAAKVAMRLSRGCRLVGLGHSAKTAQFAPVTCLDLSAMRQTKQFTRRRDMAEHKHGSMDTKEQEKTFAGFMRLVSWAGVIIVALLIFMALVNA